MKVTDLLENQDSSLWTKVKDAMKGGSPVSDKVKYGDTAYPTANKPKQQSVKEAPIEMDPSEPNNPRIYGHEKANSMTLKGRIMSARAQLKELADLAESDDLVAWEKITRLAKGGMFMGLEQNLEQIRHGIGELAAKRRKGGVQSRGIDRNIGERSVSQAQATLMAASAHNPEFAKKVGMKQSVAKEFNRADKGKNIKALPPRVPKKAKK